MSSQIDSIDLRLASTFPVLSLAAHQLHVRPLRFRLRDLANVSFDAQELTHPIRCQIHSM